MQKIDLPLVTLFRCTCLILCFSSMTLLNGCASKEAKDGKGGKISTEQQIYENAQNSLNNSNWQSAIKSLELLEENFPFGTYGEQAQLELIYAHYQARDFESAVATSERFIRLHPQHRNIDYAYYLRGLANFSKENGFLGSLLGADNTNKDPGAARNSYDQFAVFLNRYPNSAYAPDAQKRMVYVRNVIARYEIHVANYYFKRGAYLAAANRGKYVVENFQQTPAVPDGLAVMAAAYYLLGQDKLGDKAGKILASNFPDHPALLKDGSFDKKYTSRSHGRGLLNYLTFGLFDKQEIIGFDTREQYNPQYQDKKETQPEAPGAPS